MKKEEIYEKYGKEILVKSTNDFAGILKCHVPENESLKLKKLFISYGVNAGNISWIEKNVLEGNASGLETFVKFGGEV